jgi:aspartate racemase
METPEIIIYSVDVNKLLELAEAKEWDNLADWLVRRVKALQNAGADFAAIGSNTPHIVFDKIKSRSSIPMHSIFEDTCKRA